MEVCVISALEMLLIFIAISVLARFYPFLILKLRFQL